MCLLGQSHGINCVPSNNHPVRWTLWLQTYPAFDGSLPPTVGHLGVNLDDVSLHQGELPCVSGTEVVASYSDGHHPWRKHWKRKFTIEPSGLFWRNPRQVVLSSKSRMIHRYGELSWSNIYIYNYTMMSLNRKVWCRFDSPGLGPFFLLSCTFFLCSVQWNLTYNA